MTAIIHVIGNLTRDPETREAGSNSVTKLSVASNTKIKGEKVTTYYEVSVWGKHGEAAARYLSKGEPVYVWGEHRPREYESGGVPRVSEDIENASWTFTGGGKGAGSGDGGSRGPSATQGDESDYPF
jgi:single-strand DNA-binding protein